MGAYFNYFKTGVCSFDELVEKFNNEKISFSDGDEYKARLVNSGRSFKTYQEACKFINENTDKYDDFLLAVAFGDFSIYQPNTAKLKKAQTVLEKSRQELKLLEFVVKEKIHVLKKNKGYITCKDCGSKINNRFIHHADCPICRSEKFVSSQLEINKKQKLKKMMDEASSLLNEFRRTINNNENLPEVGWIFGSWFRE